jgi:hypothetical protein
VLYFILKEYLFDMYPSYQCLSVGYSHHQSYMLDSEEKFGLINLFEHAFQYKYLCDSLKKFTDIIYDIFISIFKLIFITYI